MRKKLLLGITTLALWLASCAQPTAPQTPTEVVPKPMPTVEPTPAQAPSAEPVASLEQAPCPFELAEGAVEGQDITCGYVTVPEEHARPDGATIRLAVAVIRSTAADPAADPLVVESGGPGVSTLQSVSAVLGMAEFRARSDIVLVEQRGTRYSQPFLLCDEVLDAARQMLDQNLGDEEEASLGAEALATCRDRLTAKGVNLSAYDSLENAADILVALNALGYDRFNFYGISYATKLAQHIMRDQPDRLRSVILDAVVPLPLNYVAQSPNSANRAFRRLFARCAADPSCGAAYPDLEAVFFDLLDELNENPITARFEEPEAVDVAVTGDLLVWQLHQHLYRGQTIPFLPAFIYGLQGGDDALITALGPQVLIAKATNGMSYSVRCAEETHHSEAELDYVGVHPQIVATMLDYLDYREECQVWNVEPLDGDIYGPVFSDIPTLVMSGEFDPITPPANGDLVAETLSNSYAYTFPGLGHGTFGRDSCPNSIVLDFLNDPTTAPDAACIAEMSMQFVVPTEGIELTPFTDQELGIEGVLPKGWTEVQPGVYMRLDDTATPTLLELVKLPDAPLDEQIASWLPTLGIDAFPESIGRHETPGFTWDMYALEANMPNLGGTVMVDIAMAETGAGIYFVGLYAPPPEYDALHEAVFLPVVDALAALE